VNEEIRLTKTTIAVLEVLLAATNDRPVWGTYIAYVADMEQSTVSMILKRLRELGWVEGWREKESEGLGHERYYHELTPVGYQNAVRSLLTREDRRRKQFKRYH
jgi:DNA-binding MarR family transcriptional regulator